MFQKIPLFMVCILKIRHSRDTRALLYTLFILNTASSIQTHPQYVCFSQFWPHFSQNAKCNAWAINYLLKYVVHKCEYNLFI